MCMPLSFSLCVVVVVVGGGGDKCVCFLLLFDVDACGEGGSVYACTHACIPNSLICLSLSHFLKHSHTLIGQSVLSNVMAT